MNRVFSQVKNSSTIWENAISYRKLVSGSLEKGGAVCGSGECVQLQ